MPLAGIFPRASSPLRASSPGHLPPCAHLPPGIFPHHHTLLHLPLARIFPRASSHTIIPSCTCPLRASSPGHLPTPSYPLAPAPCAHLPPGIFPRHHTILFLCNVYDDTMVAGGAVRQWRRNIRVLHVALQIDGAHNNRVTARRRLPGQFPQYPRKIRQRPLQGRAAPRLTAIEADIHLADAPVAGEG